MAVIKGGSNGNVADVDEKKRLQVLAVSEHEDRRRNTEGKYWSAYFTNTPAGANDDFFYLKNNGTKDLCITDVRISSTVPTQLFYKHVTGTAVDGTPIVLVNRNLGTSTVPDATVEQGVDITGLSDVGVIFFEEAAIADTMYSLKTTSNIIIPQGQAIAFERVEATGLIHCVVSVSECE